MRQGNNVLVEQTKMFINENPTDITITRSVRSPDGAGGFTTEPVTLNPQTVRIIEQQRSGAVERRTVSGETVTPEFVLIGTPDADVIEGDTWKQLDKTYEVVYVRIDRTYETWAEVTRRG